MKLKLDKQNTILLFKVATHIGALIPFAVLLWDYQHHQLGVDPVREITLRTGITTLILLLMSLAVTPINLITDYKPIIPLRRLLGLYAFFYVCLHFSTFLILDYGLDLGLIVQGIAEQRYVLVGFSAFLILLALAITSNQYSMRRLGKNWKRLHQLAYVAGILAILHYLWLGKVHINPIIYGIILAVLLLIRVKPIKQAILKARRGVQKTAVKRSPTI